MLALKRFVDLSGSLAALLLISPLLALLALAVKLDSPGPVFYRQERVGRKGKPFRIYKFRSMVRGAEHKGAGLFVREEDERITRVGSFLRKYSLDELPQLINVLRGEMSLVGPRPTLAYQVEKYDREQWRRLLVKPGITGWAQVNGRSSLSWPARIRLDVWYVDHWSLWLDLKILLKTLKVVCFREGIYRSTPAEKDPISGKQEEDKSNAGTG